MFDEVWGRPYAWATPHFFVPGVEGCSLDQPGVRLTCLTSELAADVGMKPGAPVPLPIPRQSLPES